MFGQEDKTRVDLHYGSYSRNESKEEATAINLFLLFLKRQKNQRLPCPIWFHSLWKRDSTQATTFLSYRFIYDYSRCSHCPVADSTTANCASDFQRGITGQDASVLANSSLKWNPALHVCPNSNCYQLFSLSLSCC